MALSLKLSRPSISGLARVSMRSSFKLPAGDYLKGSVVKEDPHSSVVASTHANEPLWASKVVVPGRSTHWR